MFQDITTLLLDPKAFRDTIDLFVERYKDQGITVVAGNVLQSHSFLDTDYTSFQYKTSELYKQRNGWPCMFFGSHFLVFGAMLKQVLKLEGSFSVLLSL